MGDMEGDGEARGGRMKEQGALSDLIDFFRRWPEFGQTAVALAGRANLLPTWRETAHWLMLLAERIGDHDIGRGVPREFGRINNEQRRIQMSWRTRLIGS
jgi:hypothetical protein